MSTIERKEKIKIEYDGSKIVIRGSTFKMAAPMNMMSLMAIYASGEGTSTVHLIVDVPDEIQEEVVSEPVPEEITVANIEPVVNVVNTEVVVEDAQLTVNTEVEVIMINPEEIVEELEPVKEPELVKDEPEFDISGKDASDKDVKDTKDNFDIPINKKESKEEFDPFNTKAPSGDKWSTFG